MCKLSTGVELIYNITIILYIHANKSSQYLHAKDTLLDWK
jgi:hypothetical protein